MKVFLRVFERSAATKKPKYVWLTPERIAAYYAQSMCYIVMNWIQSGMTISARELAEIYDYIIKRSMEDILAVSYTHLFDSERKMMTTLHRGEKENVSYTKGSPDEILERSAFLLEGGGRIPMTPEKRREIDQDVYKRQHSLQETQQH